MPCCKLRLLCNSVEAPRPHSCTSDPVLSRPSSVDVNGQPSRTKTPLVFPPTTFQSLSVCAEGELTANDLDVVSDDASSKTACKPRF